MVSFVSMLAKSAARKAKSRAKGMASDLKKEAKKQATNYLDAQKHRIYETGRGAVYTNTRGGNRNYRPTPVYRNVPGSNVITPVQQVPQMFNRQ
jgi:hypothetical protein